MKKVLALIMAVLMVLSLAACGKEQTTSNMTPEERAAAEAEIRYALGLVLDRNFIVEEVSQAGEVPASSFVAMGIWKRAIEMACGVLIGDTFGR